MDFSYTSISTNGLNHRKSREYWADHVGDACHNVQISFQRDENFDAHVEYTDIGVGKLTHLRLNGGHETVRLPHHIAKEKQEVFSVAFVRGGVGGMNSIGKDLIWRSGHVYFGGITDPYRFFAGSHLEFSIIFFDMQYVKQIVPNPEDLFMKELQGSSGWGNALTSMMSEITPRTINRLALPATAVTDHLLGLLALSNKSACDDVSTCRRALLQRLRRDMRERLFDSSITPAAFSAEHGIAARTLHAAFAATGSSFMSELIGMRLDRAGALLDDSRFNGKTIAEIAAFVGFTNPDHFSTRFRKSFGMSPTAWRDRK